MVIDCHGHYTTVPRDVQAFRDAQVAERSAGSPSLVNAAISDDVIRASVQPQLAFQASRGTDLTIFSPRASAMGHHAGDATANLHWAQICNDLVHRVCTLFPKQFVGVCQLPQTVGGSPADWVGELERCVIKLGFIGCNLNPDASGGHWNAPPLTDRAGYALYEKLVELDGPAMVHV